MTKNDVNEVMIPSQLPLIPLRDMVIYPYMIFPLLIGREGSMKAVEEAMVREKLVLVVAQRDPHEESPKRKDLYETGTVVKVLQILRLPNNVIKVLVEGVTRARIEKVRTQRGMQVATLSLTPDPVEDGADSGLEAMARFAISQFRDYVSLNNNLPDEILASIDQINQLSVLVDFIAAHVVQAVDRKQPILSADALEERFRLLNELLNSEIEILKLEQNIESQVRDKITRTQRTFYLQEQMRIIRKELGEDNEDEEGVVATYLEKMERAKLPKQTRERFEEELNRLRLMSSMSPEANVIRNYLDWILAVPWGNRTRDNLDIDRAEAILHEDHYGLLKPKERILEHLAVLKRVKKIRGQIICFVGPPGVGKTSLGRSIARAIKRNFVRISLGGVRDEAEIRGHRRTYIGAMPGRIIQSMKRAGSRNPVILLDEIDKMAMDFRGDPSAALLEVLDPQQNCSFSDHYLDLDYDLSEVMFITTANVAGAIPPALRDRMEVIQLPGYLAHQKQQIARQFLVPRQLEEHGLSNKDLQISDNTLEEIVARYTQEAGVRTLERRIAKVCRKVAREKASEAKPKLTRVTPARLEHYLGAPGVFEKRPPAVPSVGRAVGLAWTSVGGDLLEIEVGSYPGKGRLTMTGKLGEVMQESARAAMTWLRMNAARYHIANTFFDRHDLHIHLPEGAIPKDGPSAGITLVTALCSVATGRPVRNDLSMTGEVTLHGDVLPIGGLDEKAMAALRAGIQTVLIPKDNERDVAELDEVLRKKLSFIPVSSMHDVLDLALLKKPGRSRATASAKK